MATKLRFLTQVSLGKIDLDWALLSAKTADIKTETFSVSLLLLIKALEGDFIFEEPFSSSG